FAPCGAAASVDGVIGIRQIHQLIVIFIENRLGYDIFFRRPITQVLRPALLAAKREGRVGLRIRRRFANGTAMLHRCPSYPNTRNGAPVETRVRLGAGDRVGILVSSARMTGRGKISTTRPIKSYASVFSTSTRATSPTRAISPPSSISVRYNRPSISGA